QSIAVAVCNPQTVRSGDRHQRDRGRDRRASAGRARLWPGGQTRRAVSTYAQGGRVDPGTEILARPVNASPPHLGLAIRSQAARAQARCPPWRQSPAKGAVTPPLGSLPPV